MDSPAAWHPDPTGAHDHRWWDGTRWTEHVADAGVAAVDPIEGGGPPSSDPAGTTQQLDRHATSATGGPGSGPATPASDAGATQPVWSQGAAGAGAPRAGRAQGTDGYGAPSTGNDGMAIAALVVGVISLLIAWIPFVGLLGVVGGIVALVLGIVARKRITRTRAEGGGLAVGGIVTGAIALVLGLAITVGLFVFGQNLFGGAIEDFEACMERTGGDQATCQREVEDNIEDRFLD